MITLAEFRATRAQTANLGSVIDDEQLTDQAGWIYMGEFFIEEYTDGPFLRIANEQTSGALADLESALYLWCLLECPSVMQVSDELHAALCLLSDAIESKELADIIGTPREQGGASLALESHVDVNDIALEAYGNVHEMDEDGVDTLISEIYDLANQCEFATDETRGNGPRA